MYKIYGKNARHCRPLPCLAHKSMPLFLFVNICPHIKDSKNKKHAFDLIFMVLFKFWALSIYDFLTLSSNTFLSFYKSCVKSLWVASPLGMLPAPPPHPPIQWMIDCMNERTKIQMNDWINERINKFPVCIFGNNFKKVVSHNNKLLIVKICKLYI